MHTAGHKIISLLYIPLDISDIIPLSISFMYIFTSRKYIKIG